MKNNFLYVALAIAIVVIIILCIIVVCLTQKPAVNNRPGLSEDKNAVDIKEPSSNTSDGSDGISIPGFERMTIQANTQNVGANIFNPARNSCYFVAVITLADGREIYRSDLIAPGKAIYSITLSEPLAKGEYAAMLTYYCYSLNESLTPLNGATTHFILEVRE